MPVADLAGLNTQLTSTTSQNARLYPELQRPGPTTRPGEEDLSDLMHRRTEENWQRMTRRDPADPRGAVAAQIGRRSETRAQTALSRMTCPPAEPVQFLLNGTSRLAGASRHAPCQ